MIVSIDKIEKKWNRIKICEEKDIVGLMARTRLCKKVSNVLRN